MVCAPEGLGGLGPLWMRWDGVMNEWLRSPKESLRKVSAKGSFNVSLWKCNLTEFDGNIHYVTSYVDEAYRGKIDQNRLKRICVETRDTKG